MSSVPAALPPLDGQLDDLAPGTLEEISALDAAAFGIDRTRLLGLLAERASIRVLRRGDEVVGYSMCRKFGRGHVIGPVIASSDNDAIHLAAVHIEAYGGRFMRVDTRSEGPFADFLRRSGLSVSETVTTMSKGRRLLNQKPGEPIVFGFGRPRPGLRWPSRASMNSGALRSGRAAKQHSLRRSGGGQPFMTARTSGSSRVWSSVSRVRSMIRSMSSSVQHSGGA